MKERKKKNIIPKILIVFFAAIFVFSAVMLVRSILEFVQESREHARLEDDFLIYNDPADTGSETTADNLESLAPILPENDDFTEPAGTTAASTADTLDTLESTASETSAEETRPKPLWPDFSVNWDSLEKRNPDVIGWIWMYDSEISYPILLGEDNDEYLHATLDGEYAKFGSIFADYRINGDFSSPNTIIYGHNGGYGVKFGGLMNFQLYSHWENHQYICIMTRSGLAKYRIYSAYVSPASGNPYKVAFDTDEEFQSFVDKTVSDSAIYTGITPGVGDKILTLSTCTNVNDDERMIVHAVLVD